MLHAAVAIFLFLYVLTFPPEQEEGGVPVMLGEAETGNGKDAVPYSLTEVNLIPRTETSMAEAEAEEQPLITQEDEPSIEVEKGQPEPQKQNPETVTPKSEEVKADPLPKEKTEAEKRAEAEQAAAEAASDKIAGAFGRGKKMGSTGKDGDNGVQGSPAGNEEAGKTTGTGASGVFNLSGRSLGTEGLPLPIYDVQDEGRVVVTIVVDTEGRVISTQINKRTNTVNPALRRAAEEAARRARFNRVEGVNNQSGTITYYFKLR